MTVATAPLVRVGLHLGPRRIDVALDDARTFAEVLTAAQVPPVRGLLVLDSAGRVLDLNAPVAAQVEDGALVHVVAPAPRPRRGRGGRVLGPVGDDTPRRPLPVGGMLAAGSAVTLAVALIFLWVGSPDGITSTVAGAVIGTAAVALATLSHSTAATVAAPVWAGCAAVIASAPQSGPDRRLALVAGLTAAAAIAGIDYLRTRIDRQGEDLAAVLLAGWGTAAVTCAATLLTTKPTVIAAGLLVGLAPLALRLLPVLSLRVPDSQLIDLAHVSRSAPSVRGTRPRGLGRVNDRQVNRTVHAAERRADAGVLLVALLPVLLLPAVLTAALQGGALTRWAGFALVLLLLAVLALQPRTARRAVARWAPRVAAGIVLVEGVLLLGPWLGLVGAASAGIAVALALVLVAVASFLGRGWRSVLASRLADTAESLAMALVLPAALVAVDLIEILRRVTS
ncbi:hypothetical protein [Cellulomonas sp. NPDC089187]|uniref:hypothetical protein n=1 Tax=Cellulomonas sp. NPDC089187 TaxID=3154970 RepID=UPI00341C94B1